MPRAAYFARTAAALAQFRPGALTIGPWSPAHQHGGPISALLTRHALADAPADLVPARITVSLLRPVPVDCVMSLSPPDLSLSSSSVRRASLTATVDGRAVATVQTVSKRAADTPEAQLAAAGPDEFPPVDAPGAMTKAAAWHGLPDTYGTSMEFRMPRGVWPLTPGSPGVDASGRAFWWTRIHHTLVDDDDKEAPIDPLEHTMLVADCGHGISCDLYDTHTYINAELNVFLSRRPRGPWIGMQSRTAIHGEGVGLATSLLVDSAGEFGQCLQPLLVRARL